MLTCCQETDEGIEERTAMLPQNKNLKDNARCLRKNMTDAERLLWSKIRNKQVGGMQFYRQKVIGDYIVDFYCHTARLVLEIDGGQHFLDDAIEMDGLREMYLKHLGLRVLRFTNLEVMKNTEGVIEEILRFL